MKKLPSIQFFLFDKKIKLLKKFRKGEKEKRGENHLLKRVRGKRSSILRESHPASGGNSSG